MIKNIILKIFYKYSFNPKILGVFFNPFYLSRSYLYGEIYKNSGYLYGKLLDVGCGSMPYKNLFNVDEYYGLDIDNFATRNRGFADYYYDGRVFPFSSECFDSIFCSQVLEHVFNPIEFLNEIHRVLKPEGVLLLTVPFVWDEHEQPADFARYSSFGLLFLLEKNGFKILKHQKLGSDASILFQLANVYLFKIMQKWPRPLKFFLNVTLMAGINIFGVIFGKLLPNNPDLFLDQVVLAKRLI